MGSENVVPRTEMDVGSSSPCLETFWLYKTGSNFYMFGRDKNKSFWRVLKINRSVPSKLHIHEDSTLYSEDERREIVRRLREGNKSAGGLKFVAICFGIVGFIKFLGTYYMLLITKREKIGTICGHEVYAIARSEMIPIATDKALADFNYPKNENRYKKLLQKVDLTKDFFFSYSYHVMLSLQENILNIDAGLVLHENMFVWNNFLTRKIRKQLKHTEWTVSLVYGFFKQIKLSVAGGDFTLTLIARRSRHFAGTRLLKRGVNKKGRVANDVETEQIVFTNVPECLPIQISSVVQMRGSIPLFWSQEAPRWHIRPDITLSTEDPTYEATKLHFKNLVKRYGNPIIVLNLVKTHEAKPRESVLGKEYANAIEFINQDLTAENRLRFIHWDLNRYYRFYKNKATDVLLLLGDVAAGALRLTGCFYHQIMPSSSTEESLNRSHIVMDTNILDTEVSDKIVDHSVKPPIFQNGVLRTNCVDCLDRTNVAQYTYGLVALAHQLKTLGITDASDIHIDSSLARDLMTIYEEMGDTLALQYGGSAAHRQIFSKLRGQWTVPQEILTSIHRYYSNAYADGEKQDAINLFLGHFQPEEGKPALWQLDSDYLYHIGRNDSGLTESNTRSTIKRSLSEGDITYGSNSNIEDRFVGNEESISRYSTEKSSPLQNLQDKPPLRKESFCRWFLLNLLTLTSFFQPQVHVKGSPVTDTAPVGLSTNDSEQV